ncbi:probable U3 small nucleolar RNA-associated protein 11 [Neodiprion pinetum]|uniref:U3 small nucleolar RNA-associated protein 11 n=1 Tax=Neodiprion lecontei TaxID=441921 RepID=A0A6J0BC19_NEOLC|nr:probable U3 small nucleolar RNA-associated protein 11 [Neodiprion lecontei]XP_046433248.1 probable U3 small nucleolar RNA-associated protein 11 [Neodiprion fabricii]XP_046433249.1 probable U3 small nucleolar RNA-associated protein 11 [Neodiprion fabricii]XP_046433250.1 probable U3 small nucleolar RNA-associated protein 11 [Neodiprion fabricii]XP_046433251.1 probable U3 small nucleolar RNA-associated protein 11 [Neodiprion fabricii]XP_046433252.1 probable U3 small nucleolar RNA-associated pr
MSSWKRAAKANQKTHRERHQPESRAHLGLLEKKKDYVARATDYHEKQSTIKLLRKRALNKNPDEFYFHMINAKLRNGIHREKVKTEEHTPDQIKLMETQDIRYVSYKRNIEAKKIDKLQSQLHMIDAANETKNKHTFFADDGNELKSFDVAKRLDTHATLLGRRTNRPKLSKLREMKLPDIDEKMLSKMEQQKHMAYKELHKRIDRERELSIVQQKIEVKRALQDKKVPNPKQVKPATPDGPPIFQWKFQRKR